MMENHPIYQAVLAEPNNWDRYLILADACFEAGDEDAARGFRWIAHNKILPSNGPDKQLRWILLGNRYKLIREVMPVEKYDTLLEGAQSLGIAIKKLHAALGIYNF